MDDVFAYIDAHADAYVEQLRQLLRQPSVSAQGRGMAEKAAMVEFGLSKIGAEARQVAIPGGFPVVYGAIPGGSDKILRYYNHYDGQPAEPLDLWHSDPWAAEIRDGRIWARGVADNKGNLAARLAAVDAYARVRGQLPLEVRFIVEGEEEIGSPHLHHFTDTHHDLCRADACIWESGSRDLENRPLVNLGMKGICYVELRVAGADADQHSSVATATPNPAWRLVWALASLKGPDERVSIPGFYDRVVPPTGEELAMLDRMPNLERQRLAHLGIDRFLLGVSGIEILRRDYFEPTCTISDIVGGYTGAGSKTVLPSTAMAKVDMRLVADQDPDEIFALLRRHLDDQWFSDIEMTLLGPERPGRTPPSAPIARVVVEAWRALTDREPVVVPTSAGTGPWYELCTRFGVDGCPAGVGHAAANGHAPNENIIVDHFVEGIKLQCSIMERFAATA